jgi:hypothetical protein
MRLVMKQYNKKKDVNKSVNLWLKKDDWHGISSFRRLSEKFIEKYQYKKLDWCWISTQRLSEEFIERYKDKVSWYLIFLYQKLSPKFREKWKHKCGW